MKQSRRQGSALLITILIMAVLIILGTSLLTLSLGDTRNSVYQDKKTQAHYIGRSGVYVGYDLLNKQLAASDYADLNTLVADLNSSAGSLSSSDKIVSDKGSFSLSYERFSTDEIKINSTGTTAGVNPNSELVTFIVKVKPAIAMQDNPDAWINGINLIKGITKSIHYLGKGVRLEAKPIQSPQGSGTSSTYQASLFYFADHNGLALKQITNSIPITFDAEIIYFESGVELNKTGDPVILSISSDVLNYRAANTGVLPMYSPAVGFENYDRYKAFIGSYINDYHSLYEFKTGNYGLVYFGGDVYENKGVKKIEKGYYFYPNGINLQDETWPYTNLIRIKDDDAIIKALESLFKSSSSSSGYIWNKD